MASGRKRSPIWEYFVLAICQLCKGEVPRGGQSTKSYTTSNLVHHLKTKHGQEYAEYEKKKSEKQPEAPQASSSNEAGPLRQISLMEAAELHKQWDINDPSAKAIHRKIGEMIAVDCQPISVVESSGFKALIHTIAPKYRIPSRKYFAETVIPNIAQGIRAEVQAKLQEGADYISFTTDVWSSDVNSDSLLGLTAHWVDGNFQRKSAVLQAHSLDDRHTGEYIAMQLLKMLESWRVDPSKVHVIVRDNGSNMVKAMEEASLPSFGCFAHSLQLVVHDGLLSQRAVKDLLATCRSIVGHFKHSSVACHKLAHIQENLQLPKHKLKQDVVTRWNSTLYMLESILEQKMALAAYAAENNIQHLAANQLEMARKMVLVLSPVEEITQAISKETATLSIVIPHIRVLLRSWERQDDDLGIRTMKKEMTTSLKSRFAGIEENQLLAIATVLDPRFKDKFFGSSIIRATVQEMLEEELLKIEEVAGTPGRNNHDTATSPSEETKEPPSKRQKKDTLLSMFSEILESSTATTPMSSSAIEVDRYLSEPVINYKDGDPFTWWSQHKARFPLLSRLARRYLSATATSVPSERLFSLAGNVYEEHRNRILPEHAETLLFIKGNYSLFANKY